MTHRNASVDLSCTIQLGMRAAPTYSTHLTLEPGVAQIHNRFVAHRQVDPLAGLLRYNLTDLGLDLMQCNVTQCK